MASDRTLKAKAYLSNPSFQTSGSLSTVLRGVGIASIVKTSTEGLVDTYTITYTDGRTQTYEVTNGAQGERGPRGDKGPRGYTGFSAYQYAVAGGYEGTEEEFTQLMASNATMAETVEYYSWTEEIKAALLACLENVAWVNPDGQTYYDALYAALYDRTWSVENVLTGCRNTNTITAITKGRPYNGILEALSAYTMEGATVSITMGGVDVTESVYTDGVIAIPAVTGAVVITAEAVRTAWAITNALTNVTSDNPAEWVAYGAEYTATLTIPEGYEMRRVTITMGGEDVSTYYSSGTISIPAVTGDVVITAVAINGIRITGMTFGTFGFDGTNDCFLYGNTGIDARAVCLPNFGFVLENNKRYTFSLGAVAGTYEMSVRSCIGDPTGLSFDPTQTTAEYPTLFEGTIRSGWTAKDYSFIANTSRDTVAVVVFRKPDNSVLTQTDMDTLAANVSITVSTPQYEYDSASGHVAIYAGAQYTGIGGNNWLINNYPNDAFLQPSHRARYAFPTTVNGQAPEYILSNGSPSSTSDLTLSDYYPIAIPADATGFTAEITPATQFISVIPYTSNRTNHYVKQTGTGWQQGSASLSFTAGAYQYVTISSKYDSAGTSYPTAPTRFKITFTK